MDDRKREDAFPQVEAPGALPEDGRPRSASATELSDMEEGSIAEPTEAKEDIFKSPFANATVAPQFAAIDPADITHGTIEHAVEETYHDSEFEGHSAEGTLAEIEDTPLRSRSETLEDDLAPSVGADHSAAPLFSDDSLFADEDLANFDPTQDPVPPNPAVTAYGSVPVSGFGNTGYTPAAPPQTGAPATGGGFFSRLASRFSAGLSSVAQSVRNLFKSGSATPPAPGLAAAMLDDSEPATPSRATEGLASSLAPGRANSLDLGSERDAASASGISDATREDARERARSLTKTDERSRSRGPSL